jgi:hypothetical protein
VLEGDCGGVTDGVSDGAAGGDCDGAADGDCDGVTVGVSEGVTAGVSEGVTLGGVRPDCGCAKAALVSASNAALAIDLRVMAFSFSALGVRPSLQAACHYGASAVSAIF